MCHKTNTNETLGEEGADLLPANFLPLWSGLSMEMHRAPRENLATASPNPAAPDESTGSRSL